MAGHFFRDDAARWCAVQERDPTADGAFVYAVKTTKIYCRPVCKARLARRANVRFHDNPREAEQDGFRACKRCKPNTSGGMPEEAAIAKVRAMVERELVAIQQCPESNRLPATLASLAKRANLSKWHFHRVFKDTIGMTPIEWMKGQEARYSPGLNLGRQHLSGLLTPQDTNSGSATPQPIDLSDPTQGSKVTGSASPSVFGPDLLSWGMDSFFEFPAMDGLADLPGVENWTLDMDDVDMSAFLDCHFSDAPGSLPK
ncbi:methylated-DNA-protein-cysteine methyltransferase [Chaetomium sp. MPI-SDFR-AT-0129]|nr:methylated-DNA-protein-cysteine methyltransferase [Chaetomium sp. MPI-SDFR-AT-0129]